MSPSSKSVASEQPHPTPAALAALDPEQLRLGELAKTAQGADEKARRYAKETPDAGWSAMEYLRLCSDARITRQTLADACSLDVILALLAAARHGAGDTELRTSLARNVTVALEFAAHDLDSDTPNVERALGLVREALTECRRLLSDVVPHTDDAADAERYREALRFYADPASYRRPASKFSVDDGDWLTYPTPVDADRGVNARAALIRAAHPEGPQHG